ncbi:phosphocholine-specific phospholipase C [Massilia terrae]|uniref:phospholipase C n=1 Tax=Massilia terrae TaxID=1811224 RepID=A0ABT2CT10_9BURK|nr:phospholipase C, phosphocholine-specific [Massilia terrae]MCS0657123.1 phospholipase C, phosphocholine-specific [Massilia terrae]
MKPGRRRFLRAGAVAAGAAALPASIARALAIPAARVSGTTADVEHVVILMQENRSFDHYFGTLAGVRGFGDPRPLTLREGRPVWYQPGDDGRHVLPFALRAGGGADDRSQCLESDLPHTWKGSQRTWAFHDAWVHRKGHGSMGYLTRQDIPFYFALADAFTIGDAYHASLFGPTNPNRMFLFSGTNGLSVNRDGFHALDNVDDLNYMAPMALDQAAWISPYTWTTYAERLSAHQVSWKVYQEYDNYGCNALAYFPQFRKLDLSDPEQRERYRCARAYAGEAAGLDGSGVPVNANPPDAQALVDLIAADVRSGALPAVSWIVSPAKFCEHPEMNPPGYGESLVARILDALTASPEVWAKTALIICYDEEGGFFDHVPPPVPPASPGEGYSGVPTTGETSGGEAVGLGARVPLLVVSPWTRGGWVCSEVFDHTSILRFLERRFGVAEPNISPWRRTVCGDLTSMFDFAHPNADRPGALFDTSHRSYLDRADALCRNHGPVAPPLDQALPAQERGAGGDATRPARPLPYHLAADGAREGDRFRIAFANSGRAGAAFTVYSLRHHGGPWYYTLPPGDAAIGSWGLQEFRDRQYDLRVYGPNGFLRVFRGGADSDVEARVDETARGTLALRLENHAARAAPVRIEDHAYGGGVRELLLDAGASVVLPWPVEASHGWYDIGITTGHDGAFARRFCGHVEDGMPSRSDPAFGAAREQAV